MQKDKIDTCSGILADTIVGFFAGNYTETTIHGAYAVMTVARDICKFYFDKQKFQELGLSSEQLAVSGSELMRKNNNSLSETYNGSCFVNVMGDMQPRVVHLITKFSDFTAQSNKWLNKPGSHKPDWLSVFNKLRDKVYQDICNQGLRRNPFGREGILLVESWDRQHLKSFRNFCK